MRLQEIKRQIVPARFIYDVVLPMVNVIEI